MFQNIPPPGVMILLSGLFLGISLLFDLPIAQSAVQETTHFVVDIVSINGEEFVVKDENGKEGKINVDSDTEKFGRLQAGDRIDAWVFPNGHAKTIMVLRSGSIIQDERQQQKQRESGQRAEAQQSVSPPAPAR
jgi:hypothetical protein